MVSDAGWSDNTWKRHRLVGRLLSRFSWVKQRVLEIGIGSNITAIAMHVALLGEWYWTGTDMSPEFARQANERDGLRAVVADVTDLPGDDGEYSRVLALDSLEHVHPDDREQGYAEIARVTAQGGFLVINMPLQEDLFSQHVQEFDHRMDLNDLDRLEKAGFFLQSYEVYTTLDCPEPRPYAFVVMERL